METVVLENGLHFLVETEELTEIPPTIETFNVNYFTLFSKQVEG